MNDIKDDFVLLILRYPCPQHAVLFIQGEIEQLFIITIFHIKSIAKSADLLINRDYFIFLVKSWTQIGHRRRRPPNLQIINKYF